MKEKYTEKLYYKAYDHRVSIHCRAHHQKWRSKTMSRFNGCPTWDEAEEFVKNNSGDIDHRTRCTSTWNSKIPGRHFVVYFKDPQMLEILKNQYSDYIDVVERPLNSDHSELLSKERVLTRKTLFHGKFRYCFRAKPKVIPGTYRTNNSELKEMADWVRSTFKDSKEYTDFQIHSGWSFNYFFSNPQDAMLFKLTWNDHIDQCDRIKLISEIEETPDSQ